MTRLSFLAGLWLTFLSGSVHAQTLTTLYTFSGPDGSGPQAPLTLGTDGNSYGTTWSGGASNFGTVFKITPSGALTTLHSFAGSNGSDGGSPNALTLGNDGNFYGTAGCCGLPYPQGGGTVFSITPSGALTTLHSFVGTDGWGPVGALTLDPTGNFYGVTRSGVYPYGTCGTVFHMTTGGTFSEIYSFGNTISEYCDGPLTGSIPSSGLVLAGGNYYGTTTYDTDEPPYGHGTVYRMTPSGAVTWLHFFDDTDGAYPITALTLGGDGNLYGTTNESGAGYGTVFQMTLSGNFTTLHTFQDSDGASPASALLWGTDGNLYGTTSSGGPLPQSRNIGCCGTIFKLTPDGALTILHYFNGTDGNYPIGLTIGNDGNFYGTTQGDGLAAMGTVFRLALCTPPQACTSTTLTSGPSPTSYGDTVTLTAHVTPTSGSGAPTGLVTFTDGGAPLGSVALTGGTAFLETSTLSLGLHSIAAYYAGNGAFQGSASVIAYETVNQTNTNTALVSSVNPSSYSQPVTLTANVTPASGSALPTGTVTFKDGSIGLGIGTLSNGSTSLPPVKLSTGTHSITATYSGDTNYVNSAGSLSQVVNQVVTTTTLKSSANPSLINQQVTFTATLAGLDSSVATGTVSFLMNGSPLGTPATVAKGKATLGWTFTAAGTFAITAAYSGDANFAASTSPALNQQVDGSSPTTTSSKSSGSPSLVGEAVTFTATVKATFGSVPNGEAVTFNDGSALIGTGSTASGVATFSTASLAAGTHSITASYAGDAGFQPSASSVVKQVVQTNATTTVLRSSMNPSSYGQSVTLTATVSSAGPMPTGMVSFKNGTASLGSGTLSGGVATLNTTKIPAGSNSITASYSGDAASAKSTSAPLDQVVNPASSTTSLASSKNPSNLGQSVTFTATVSSAYATPGGTVTFTMGATTLGTVTLAGGKARLAVTTLPAGSDLVTATYNGSADFGGSSGSVTQTVN